jgi:hypothetical protein
VVTSANFLVDSESSLRAAFRSVQDRERQTANFRGSTHIDKKTHTFLGAYRLLVIFIVAAAIVYSVYAMKNIPLDAIPDLSDTQVIIYSRWDRSPDIIEDQVTYPVISSLLGAPR